MEHPLKVYMPLDGRFYLCKWHCHAEQHQVILAQSEKSLFQTTKVVLDKFKDAEVRELYLVEMVSPPEERCRQAAIQYHQEEVEQFISTVCFRLTGRPTGFNPAVELPKGFVECPGYRCEYEDAGKPSNHALEYHTCCANCYGKIALDPSVDREQFFQEFSPLWYAKHPKRSWSSAQATYSRARVVSSGEKIWKAFPDFGHHSHGVRLEEVGEEILTGNVLFYYIPLIDFENLPLMQKVSSFLEETKNARAARELEKNAAFLKSREDREAEQYQEMFEIFGRKS